MAELTPEEIRELLEGTTPGPWIAVARSGQTLDEGERSGLGFDIEGPPEPMLRGQFANGPDARLIATAPDLARQLLAAMEENERLTRALGRQKAKTDRANDRRDRVFADASDVIAKDMERMATLEGIVRRHQRGWEPMSRTGDEWLWVTTHLFMERGVPYAEEPCTEAEALILKEMQQ